MLVLITYLRICWGLVMLDTSPVAIRDNRDYCKSSVLTTLAVMKWAKTSVESGFFSTTSMRRGNTSALDPYQHSPVFSRVTS